MHTDEVLQTQLSVDVANGTPKTTKTGVNISESSLQHFMRQGSETGKYGSCVGGR